MHPWAGITCGLPQILHLALRTKPFEQVAKLSLSTMLNVKQMPIVRPYNDKRVKIFWDILQLPKVNVEVHASPSQFDNDDDGEEDKEVGADDDNAADDDGDDDDDDDDDDDGEEDKEVGAS